MAGSYRRRSTSNRAAMMPDSQAHAIVGHLLALQMERDLSVGQSRFLDVLIAELVHRRRSKPWTEQCRCRVCIPAAPMGRGTAEAED